MPKLAKTFARKAPYLATGTAKHWDVKLKGLVLFTGKRMKTWYFQKDVGGHTKRILIDRYPTISADAAARPRSGCHWRCREARGGRCRRAHLS